MKSTGLRWARLFAWGAALGVLAMVPVVYERLPDMLPVTRWSSVERSWSLALRIPTINLLTLVLAEVLVRPLQRSEHEAEGLDVASALFVTVGMKALVEGFELLSLPKQWATTPFVLIAVVALGLGWAVFRGRKFVYESSRPSLAFTRAEKLVATCSALGIVAFQVAPIL